MWILRKIRLSKCDFCEKWDFEIMNFVKHEILKIWILWKNFSKFLYKLRIFAQFSVMFISDFTQPVKSVHKVFRAFIMLTFSDYD